ncbi:MAG: TetR/AcrR family transcriptional regulator [Mycobacteriaceae bacterium]
MATATPTKRARTRESLLVGLQELLLDPDGSAISVPQLVARSAVAQGTFYNYFDSLPEAIDAVGALILAEHARVLGAVTAGAADEAEVVARSARQTLMLLAHRPDVGRLLFDSGLPADRFAAGVRAHLHADLQRGIDSGVFAVADFEVVCTVYAGVILGACLDIHRGRLPVSAVSAVVEYLLQLLGVGKPKARRLVSAPMEFVQWRPLPLSGGEV